MRPVFADLWNASCLAGLARPFLHCPNDIRRSFACPTNPWRCNSLTPESGISTSRRSTTGWPAFKKIPKFLIHNMICFAVFAPLLNRVSQEILPNFSIPLDTFLSLLFPRVSRTRPTIYIPPSVRPCLTQDMHESKKDADACDAWSMLREHVVRRASEARVEPKRNGPLIGSWAQRM